MDSSTLISDWNKLGSLVKDARGSRGWSQQVLADRAGVSRAWVAKLEGGHRGAELEQILRLLEALDLHLIAQTAGAATAVATARPIATAAPSPTADLRLAASRRRRAAWEMATSRGTGGQRESP